MNVSTLAAKFPLQWLGSMVSPGGRRGRLSILIYHRVLAQPDPLPGGDIDATTFDQLMAVLKLYCNVLPLSEAVERLYTSQLPPRAVCITFDDGYADNVEVALPVLRKHNLPATFFISTGYLDGGIMWNDVVTESIRQAEGPELDLNTLGLGSHSISSFTERRHTIQKLLTTLKHMPPSGRYKYAHQVADATSADLPDDLMMSTHDIRTLHAAGMEIGGHTVTHPILTRVNNVVAREEIMHGKETLENIIDAPVKLFAYPNGKPKQDYDQQHISLLEELGFTAAVSTSPGVGTLHANRFELPRFTPWDRTPHRFVGRLLRNCLRTSTDTAGQ